MTANERDHTDNKGDKTGRTADEEGFFGSKRTQHYDAADEPIGTSQREKTSSGEEYVQHYDETGEETGRSKVEKDGFGEETTLHYNNQGEETGRSRAEKGMFGDEYVQHYNARGDEIGRTRVDERARELHQREHELREFVKEAGRRYRADGALKLKDLRNVAWGPTLKLAFWRGVACAPGVFVLVALLADGPIYLRLLVGFGGAVVWALTAWYGAVLNYIVFRAIGAVVGPLTLGIGYLFANLGLFILAVVMSLGDPIIAYINRRSPHFFEIDDYPTFSMKSMIFIVKTNDPHVQRPAAPMGRERDQSTTAHAPAPESTSPPRREQDQDDHTFTGSSRATDVRSDAAPNESSRKRSPIGALIFGCLVLGGGIAGFFFLKSGPLSSPVQQTDGFQVQPYSSEVVLVAKEDGLHFRIAPFARPDIAVIRDSVAGEILTITGVVSQPDGAWYQVQLADGNSGYFKASLAISQSEYASSSVLPLLVLDQPLATITLLRRADGGFDATLVGQNGEPRTYVLTGDEFDLSGAQSGAVFALTTLSAFDADPVPVAGSVIVPTSHYDLGGLYAWRTSTETAFSTDYGVSVRWTMEDHIIVEISASDGHLIAHQSRLEPVSNYVQHILAESPSSALRSRSLDVLRRNLDQEFGTGSTAVTLQNDGRLRIQAIGSVDPVLLSRSVQSRGLTVVEQMSGP